MWKNERQYRPTRLKAPAAPGALLLSDATDATAPIQQMLAPVSSIAAAWGTDQLMELRAPLARRRMKGEDLGERDRELLDYLDVELDRRLGADAHAPTALGALLAQTRRILRR